MGVSLTNSVQSVCHHGVKMPVRRPLSVMVALLMVQSAWAEDVTMPSASFDEIKVVADKRLNADVGEKVETAKSIQENLVQSNEDLVRYNPEISVAEVGRYGSQGFAIRGVDGNRVAMSYNGVNLPEVEVNQIFLPYGYMYTGRVAPDVELMSGISLQTGADSLDSGSGAIGGAVNYRSKEPTDLIQSGKQLGGYVKTGYTDKNQEMMTAVGLAGVHDKFEAMVNYVYREGHELKNHRMLKHNKDKLNPDYQFAKEEIGTSGILPDPSHYESHGTLAKLYYNVSDDHRIGLHGSYQYQLNHNHAITKGTTDNQRRIGYDEAQLESYGMNYRYQPLDDKWLKELNLDAVYQKVVTIGHTRNHLARDLNFDPNSSATIVDKNSYFIEYRPTYDTTKQLKLAGDFLPIDTEKLGFHQLSFTAQYANKFYESLQANGSASNGVEAIYPTFIYIPDVKRDTLALTLTDNIKINDKLDVKVGLRYDHYKFKPEFNAHQNYVVHEEITKAGYGKETNAYKNMKDVTKKQLTWQLGLGYKLDDNWNVRYKLSTGFLSPTITQLYSAFAGQGVEERPNFDLEAETSLNNELEFQGDFTDFSVKLAGFYTDYKDFIDSHVYQSSQSQVIEYRNIDKAKTYGVRLGGMWDISELVKTDGTLKLTGDISLAKDSTSKGTNLLATQPPTGVFGLDYQSPNADYDIHAKLRYLGAKKAKDAKILDRNDNVTVFNKIDESKTALVFDLYGTKRFDNGFSMSAGVYNLFDKKYYSWENLRTLAVTNINNRIGLRGEGIARYTEPGRNYAISLNYEF